MAHLAHYKEAHPLPFVITHWINLIAMICLIVTGFSIHFPFWPDFMGVARGVHIFCGFVLFINCIVRASRLRTTRPGCPRRTIVISWALGSSTTCS